MVSLGWLSSGFFELGLRLAEIIIHMIWTISYRRYDIDYIVINLKVIISLWRGLNAGLAYQVVMNGTRLTLFDFMKDHGDGFKLHQLIIQYLYYFKT